MNLPFQPWWYKPIYIGRHRGTYQHRDYTTPIFIGTKTVRLYWYEPSRTA